jgi:hypothetical protein
MLPRAVLQNSTLRVNESHLGSAPADGQLRHVLEVGDEDGLIGGHVDGHPVIQTERDVAALLDNGLDARSLGVVQFAGDDRLKLKF